MRPAYTQDTILTDTSIAACFAETKHVPELSRRCQAQPRNSREDDHGGPKRKQRIEVMVKTRKEAFVGVLAFPGFCDKFAILSSFLED